MSDKSESGRSAGEVSLVLQDDGLLVAGDPAAVARYVDRLRTVVGPLRDAGVTERSLSEVGAAASALGALGATGGAYFTMSPESLQRFQAGGAIPGGQEGYFKGILHNGLHFDGNLDFKQVSFAAEQALSVQCAMATVALRAAINEVQEAVARVEGKVDDLVALTKAAVIGEVIGYHRVLTEYVTRLERTSALPAVDWDTVAALGPDLVKGVEILRRYVRTRVDDLDIALPAADRSDRLRGAVDEHRIGEVLELLVVAEDSLYLWQRLRVERTRATEPEHLGSIVDSARTQLREDLRADGELAGDLSAALVTYANLRPLEVHRRWSKKRLETSVGRLRGELDEFVAARRMQAVEWPPFEQPTLVDARDELQRRANETGKAVKHLGAGAVDLSAEQARKAQHAVAERVRKLRR